MNLRLTPTRLAMACAAVILLSGCAVMHLQAPAISLTSVELTDVQIDQQRFTVQLHVQNPNDRPLPIKSVSCTLDVEGVEVGQGQSTAPFTVPANGESDVEMLVTTNFATSVPNLLLRVVQRKQLPEYHLSGWVNPDQALLPPIPFSKSDRITIPQEN
jgi:LEA14-like dessication related protein